MLTALASYLDARHHHGQWFIRLDDLDKPRSQPGADQRILSSLTAHGLIPDSAPQRQSEHLHRYERALEQLIAQGDVFVCTCSRRQLRELPMYPGTCRERLATHRVTDDAALRILARPLVIAYSDRVQGERRLNAQSDLGDFIVWRRDRLPSYQIATAVDDGASDVTHVLRGNDLLGDTPRQLYLMHRLGLTPPSYAHWPVLVDEHGIKLSKQAGATAIDDTQVLPNLHLSLGLLGMGIDSSQAQWPPQRLLQWAAEHWQPQRQPAAQSVSIADVAGASQPGLIP